MYLEGLFLDSVYREPNETTRITMEDAKAGRTEGPIDTTSVEAMLKSILDGKAMD